MRNSWVPLVSANTAWPRRPAYHLGSLTKLFMGRGQSALIPRCGWLGILERPSASGSTCKHDTIWKSKRTDSAIGFNEKLKSASGLAIVYASKLQMDLSIEANP